MTSFPTAAPGAAPEHLGGLTGLVIDVVDRLGEVGIAVLTLLETVFPPIPSEIVLPLGGFLAQQGRLSPWLVIVGATAGSLAGAWILYALGARLGEERSTALFARVPLIDGRDVERSIDWFRRHGEWAVFFGRLMPGVRSLVSVPAGTARMPLWRFSLLTAVGSLLWNGLLVGGGMALGTQWRLVEKYSSVLDVVMIAAVAGVVGLLLVRHVRRVRSHGAEDRDHDADDEGEPARPEAARH